MNNPAFQRGTNLKELAFHGNREFPLQYYVDDLVCFPDSQIPLHWHTELEFFLSSGPVLAQIGRSEILLEKGWAIFVNSNVLHSFTLLSPEPSCLCPNIVFSGDLIAPASHIIHQKYIRAITADPKLPCILLKPCVPWQKESLSRLDRLFSILQKYGLSKTGGKFPLLPFEHADLESPCFEMQVQNELNHIWQLLYSHLTEIPSVKIEKGEHTLQIRIQKMLNFIYDNYASRISLEDIAGSANISKSEATRCFQAYMNQPPVSHLLDYRLEKAKELLSSTTETVEEISRKCGFQSSGYFCRVFRKRNGMSPKEYQRH